MIGYSSDKEGLHFFEKCGIENDSTYNTLYNKIKLPFKNKVENLNFTFSGIVEPDSLGSIIHEYTHYWYTLSPLYYCIDEIKYRAIYNYFEFVGKDNGDIALPWRIACNYYLWKYAETIESLINPIMEGSAFFSEFDSGKHLNSNSDIKTLPDLLKEKLVNNNYIIYKHTAEILSKDKYKELRTEEITDDFKKNIQNFDLFYKIFTQAAHKTSGKRKADLFMLMPLLSKEKVGGHLLGYISIKGIYLFLLEKLSHNKQLYEIFTPSLFLHYIRQKFFFNEELINLIYQFSSQEINGFDQLNEIIYRTINSVYKIYTSIFYNENLEKEVNDLLNSLKTWKHSLGCPIPDLDGSVRCQTELESVTYNRALHTITSCSSISLNTIYYFAIGNYLRKNMVKFNTIKANIKNTNRLIIKSNIDENTQYLTITDPYPLKDISCSDDEYIDISNLLYYDGEEIRLLNAFWLNNQPYLCTSGFEQNQLNIEGDITEDILNNINLEHDIYNIMDSVSKLCDEGFPESERLKRIEFDKHWVKRSADIYLDIIHQSSLISFFYAKDEILIPNKWNNNYPDSFYKPNTIYADFMSKYFSAKEFRDFILSTIDMDLNNHTPSELTIKYCTIHNQIIDDYKNLNGLFAKINNKIFSLF